MPVSPSQLSVIPLASCMVNSRSDVSPEGATYNWTGLVVALPGIYEICWCRLHCEETLGDMSNFRVLVGRVVITGPYRQATLPTLF